MGSNIRMQTLRMILLQPLLLILCGIGPWTVSGSSSPITHEVEVGGNVTLVCPVDENRQLYLLYFQKDGPGGQKVFVNGYHSTQPLTTYLWPNTEMALNNTAVVMYNVNISHSGTYECVISYNSASEPTIISQDLIVTAPYSKPSVTHGCYESNGKHYYHVTCVSYDGYPYAEVKWKVSQRQSFNVSNPIVRSNSSTGFLSISSTAHFSCSGGELQVNCSVANAVSDNFSICPRTSPDITRVTICSVLAVVLIMIGGGGVALWMRCKKRRLSCLQGVPADTGGATREEIMEFTVKTEVNS